MCKVFTQMIGCLTDFAFTRQKNEYITLVRWITPKLIQRICDGIVHIKIT